MQTPTTNQSWDNNTLKELFATDMLRALFMSRIAMKYLDELLTWDHTPEQVKIHARAAMESYSKMEKQALLSPVIKNGPKWLEKELGKEKLLDVATIIEIMIRIGTEEDDTVYEEFLGLLVENINSVFYAQKNRKNIWFPKYKALFKLIGDELKADTNKLPGQVWYRGGELWLRTSQPHREPKLED